MNNQDMEPPSKPKKQSKLSKFRLDFEYDITIREARKLTKERTQS